jgi:ERCC4-type nuclease
VGSIFEHAFLHDRFVVDTLTITVDVQERRSGVPEMLVERGVSVDFVTLAVGDYAFGDRVVERKTVVDLHLSLKTRRIWGQVASLRRDPRRAYLLVEGGSLDDGPVPPRAVRGALLKVLDNGIRLLRTASKDDSALWLHVFAAQEHRRLAPRATTFLPRQRENFAVKWRS